MTSKKQTIAIDVDDVLAINIPAFVKFSNKKWGTNLSIEDYEENWMVFWGVDEKEMRKRAEVVEKEFFHILAHSGEALPILKKLSRDYKLVVATSRRRVLKEVTKEWIDKYFEGLFEEIHHAGIFDGLRDEEYMKRATQATKAKLCEEIGADYLIDDHPKHCIGADMVGVKSILFGNYPWNREVEVPDTVVRLKDWNEVGGYFAGQRG